MGEVRDPWKELEEWKSIYYKLNTEAEVLAKRLVETELEIRRLKTLLYTLADTLES